MRTINDRLHSRLRVLPAWAQLGLALVAGVMAAFAHVPWVLTVLYFPAAAVLLTLLQQACHPRWLMAIGFCWAFGYFLPNVAWISRALTVDTDQFGWMVPLAVLVIPSYLALYYGLALRALWGLTAQPGTLALGWALLWFLAEMARSHLLFAFPWALQGMVWAENLALLQLTSLIGIEGLSLLTLLAAASFWLLLQDCRRYGLWALLLLAVFAISYGWGQERLAATPLLSTTTTVRLVQPNIPQSLKWDKEQAAAHFQQLLDLSARNHWVPDAIIWPETASPYDLDSHEAKRWQAASVLAPSATLLAGGNRARYNFRTGALEEIWNSLFVLDARGRMVALYDKHQLVPFGEYVPLRRVLPVEKITHGSLDFSRGNGVRTLAEVPGLPAFSPLICYEAIFSGAVVNRQQRPSWLLNITNDAWYGDSAGPYQHAAISRVRAIEEGLPMVRVANTGISFVVDALGREVARSALNTTFVADVALPEALAPTLFARAGHRGRLILIGILLISLVFMQFFGRSR